MQVEILKACETTEKKFKKGDVADIQDAIASAWIDLGYAKHVKKKGK